MWGFLFTTENEHRIHLTHCVLPSSPWPGWGGWDFKAARAMDSLGWMSLWKEVAKNGQRLWGHMHLKSCNSSQHSHHLCPPLATSRLCLPFPLGVGQRHGSTNAEITTSTPEEGIYLIAKEHILAVDNKWCVMLPWSEMDGALCC